MALLNCWGQLPNTSAERCKRSFKEGSRTQKKIVDNAVRKSSGLLDEEGSVPPRVLRDVINDGSYREDEISVEYFGGVLASSRTPSGRDDRGASFTSLLSRLTTYQIRSHYIFYLCLREVFLNSEMATSDPNGRSQLRVGIEIGSFVKALDLAKGEAHGMGNVLEHVAFGLNKEDLIDNFNYGNIKYCHKDRGNVAISVIDFTPSFVGSELLLRAVPPGNSIV